MLLDKVLTIIGATALKLKNNLLNLNKNTRFAEQMRIFNNPTTFLN
jgi:hypothetical protein